MSKSSLSSRFPIWSRGFLLFEAVDFSYLTFSSLSGILQNCHNWWAHTDTLFWTAIHILFKFPSFCLFMFQDPIQGATWHVVIVSVQASLGLYSFRDSLCFNAHDPVEEDWAGPLRLSHTGIYLEFLSRLDGSWVLWKQITEVKSFLTTLCQGSRPSRHLSLLMLTSGTWVRSFVRVPTVCWSLSWLLLLILTTLFSEFPSSDIQITM